MLIDRVLCNLLENAAKYTPAGSEVRIDGGVTGTSDDVQASDEVRLVIEDNGPGVPPGKEREIFEKFTRGERESATAGVGLGLAVCAAIMQAHGGRIWVENAQSEGRVGGARFVVALPRGNPPAIEPEHVPPEAAAIAQPVCRQRRRMLARIARPRSASAIGSSAEARAAARPVPRVQPRDFSRPGRQR